MARRLTLEFLKTQAVSALLGPAVLGRLAPACAGAGAFSIASALTEAA